MKDALKYVACELNIDTHVDGKNGKFCGKDRWNVTTHQRDKSIHFTRVRLLSGVYVYLC